jgi:hypothetical protein
VKEFVEDSIEILEIKDQFVFIYIPFFIFIYNVLFRPDVEQRARRKTNNQSINVDDKAAFAKKSGSMALGKDSKTNSLSGKRSLGKMALKSLGFKTAKSGTINFYDKWKVQPPHEHLGETLVSLLRGFGLDVDDESIGQFIDFAVEKLAQTENPSGALSRAQLLSLVRS